MSSRFDELIIPQPPYRMKRPVARLIAAESLPSNMPVLPPEMMQELEQAVVQPSPVPPTEKAPSKSEPIPAEFHEEFPQPKETKEQEAHRLAKEALDKLNEFRNVAERPGTTPDILIFSRARAAEAQKKLDEVRTREVSPPSSSAQENLKEVGSERVYIKPGTPEYEELQKKLHEAPPSPKAEAPPPLLEPEAPPATPEVPRTRKEVEELSQRIEQLGDPEKPEFFEQFNTKSGSLEDFLVTISMTFANRWKKKREYHQHKMDEHLAKMKEAAKKGWIRGAFSGFWHENQACKHATKVSNAFRKQERWHADRMMYESRRNEIIEDLVARIDRPITMFREWVKHYTKNLEEADKLLKKMRSELEDLYRELADLKTMPARRTELEKEITNKDKQLRELIQAISELEIRRTKSLVKVKEQEQCKDELLSIYVLDIERPETAPEKPSWMKQGQQLARHHRSASSK